MPARIPLDPALPDRFDDTPNEERTKAELDAWWDHPFGVTFGDGTIEVRCLHGGAHDRSSWLGNAPDYDAACALAAEKLADWIRMREKPVAYWGDKIQVVRMPQRPDHRMEVIAEFETSEEASAYLKKHYGEY